jgi:hypothetical protein
MLKWLHNQNHRTGADDATDLTVVTPDWEAARDTVTVIDVDEFEAAHKDPEWLAFCERADEYLESVQRELVH